MAKIPVILPSAGIGSANPAAAPPAVSGVGGTPSLAVRGPAQSKEHFSAKANPATWARGLNRTQTAVQQAMSVVKAVPFLSQGGSLVTNQVFTAGTAVAINHGLGRPYAGYFVLNVRGGYGSFQDSGNPNTGLNAQQITLKALNNCTADLWIY